MGGKKLTSQKISKICMQAKDKKLRAMEDADNGGVNSVYAHEAKWDNDLKKVVLFIYKPKADKFCENFHGGLSKLCFDNEETILNAFIKNDKRNRVYVLNFAKLPEGVYFVHHPDSFCNEKRVDILECILQREQCFQGRDLVNGGRIINFSEDENHPIVVNLMKIIDHARKIKGYSNSSFPLDIAMAKYNVFIKAMKGDKYIDLSRDYLVFPKF